MAQQPPGMMKATLDKDLDKVTRVEEATQYITYRVAGPGAGILFLVLAMILAGSWVMGQPGAAIVIVAAAIAAYMAINIGANDVTNNVGAAVGARALSMTAALVIAAIFEIAGAMIAGGNVVETISTGIIAPSAVADSTRFIWVMMSGLIAAALWVNLSTWIRAPVSTTHAIIGGIIGGGAAASGFAAVDWLTMTGIATSWVVSPFLGGIVAAAFLAFIKEFIIYRSDKIASAKRWVPVLLAVMTGSFIAFLALAGLPGFMRISPAIATLTGIVSGLIAWLLFIPVIRAQSQGLENRNQSLRKLFRLPLVFSAALLSFAHGASDVSNAVGPLAAIVDAVRETPSAATGTTPLWVMAIGAFGISAGILLFGPRLIRLVGEQITKLNPMRAFCVALSTALTVIIASWFGLPVSSTHIAIGSVFGVGFFREWYTRNSRRRIAYMHEQSAGPQPVHVPERNVAELRRRYLVRRSHFMTIAAAWVITVPVVAGLAAAVYLVMFRLFA